MYKVIKYFTDRQDNNYTYHEGDTYPREGLDVTEKRLNELASSNNRRKMPLIENADETKTKSKARKKA